MRTSLPSLSEIALPSRYELLFRLASGGTASVHVGKLQGVAGFRRLVAVKAAHAHLDNSPEYREMMVDEARLAAQIHHPNVVPVIDVEEVDGRLLLIMEYVEGASLAELRDNAESPMPPAIAIRIALDACAGLQAAHELTDDNGQALGLVHRDVSPQNVLVGVDGVARLTDFGIAKTTMKRGRSVVGTLKGKLAYMAPEYITGQQPDARCDVFGLGIVVWEMLAGKRLFRGENGHETLCNVLYAEAPMLSTVTPSLGSALDLVISVALAKNPESRFPSVRAFSAALEATARRANLVATQADVAEYVTRTMGAQITERRRRIAECLEHGVRSSPAPSAREPLSSPMSSSPFSAPLSSPFSAPLSSSPFSAPLSSRPCLPPQPPARAAKLDEVTRDLSRERTTEQPPSEPSTQEDGPMLVGSPVESPTLPSRESPYALRGDDAPTLPSARLSDPPRADPPKADPPKAASSQAGSGTFILPPPSEREESQTEITPAPMEAVVPPPPEAPRVSTSPVRSTARTFATVAFAAFILGGLMKLIMTPSAAGGGAWVVATIQLCPTAPADSSAPAAPAESGRPEAHPAPAAAKPAVLITTK